MRIALLGFAALVAVAASAGTTASAQESFFNERYCAIGGGSRGSGIADCAYRTWEQCRESASGLGKYCSENPFWQPKTTGEGAPQRKSGRR